MPERDDMTQISRPRTPLIGVFDFDGRPWCYECCDAERLDAGDTGFAEDVYATGNAYTRCSQCGRKLSEVPA
jgi:hypothetical protein